MTTREFWEVCVVENALDVARRSLRLHRPGNWRFYLRRLDEELELRGVHR